MHSAEPYQAAAFEKIRKNNIALFRILTHYLLMHRELLKYLVILHILTPQNNIEKQINFLNKLKYTFQYFVVDNGYTTADDSTEARVRIKKLTYDQVGGYTCRAQNKLGSAEKKFDVQLGSQTDCNIGLCESYSSAGSSGLNTGIVFGISLIGSVILFMTVK